VLRTFAVLGIFILAFAGSVRAGTISEFPHPPLVVEFHPSPRDLFTLEDIDRALREGASAVELDLRYRARDQSVVCSHSSRGLGDRPTLGQAIQRVLRFQDASPTVHRDSLQFFIILDFKERSAELYEGVIAVLRDHVERWSTSAGPDGQPRGITVLASGEHAGLTASIPPKTLDSLCIVEGTDYRGRIRDRSPRPGRTFQWIAIQHPAERGRIRALHHAVDLSARGVFNVRVYDAHGAIESCIAAGADAVNADREEIVRARALANGRP